MTDDHEQSLEDLPTADPDGAPVEESTLIINSKMIQQVRESTQHVCAYLIVLSGPDVGTMRRIEDASLMLGRSDDADMRIKDVGISRRHARLVNSNYGVMIEDMGSANGTFLNGERIQRPTQLQDGDKITLGSTTILKFTYHDRLEEDFQRQMFEAALRDSLTGAYNKRYFLDHIESEFSYAYRHGQELSLIMFDVDHFKRVNDNFGHPAGDHVLMQLSDIAHRSIRSEDLFARYGGEEFAVVCRGSGMHQAAMLGERLRATVEATPFIHENQVLPVRISVGVAGVQELPVRTSADLITAADTALYAAKHGGRNRVMLAAPPAPER